MMSIFSIFLISLTLLKVTISNDLKFSPNNKHLQTVKSKINVQIDLSNKLGTFDEKVLYNLEFDNNEMKSVSYEKTLPKINSDIFDMKVNSKDVNISKYEVLEKDKKKYLHVEFTNEVNNKTRDRNVNIEYQYKTKDLSIVEESKNKFVLKDVGFFDENGSNYPTKFIIEFKNLPKNLKLNTLEIGDGRIDGPKLNELTKPSNLKRRVENEKEEKEDQLKIHFNTHMGKEGNKLPKERKLRVEFIDKLSGMNSEASTATRIQAKVNPSSPSTLNPDGSGLVVKKSYYYKDNKKDDTWEAIIAILMLICICFLCCQCCKGNANSAPVDKQQNNNDAHHDANADLNYY
jgi:hypothetical protein